MSYKITIEETKIVTQMVRGKHEKIDEVMTDAQCMDGELYMKAIYGYAPDREDEVETTQTMFEQVVDELDLVRVISAINSIGE